MAKEFYTTTGLAEINLYQIDFIEKENKDPKNLGYSTSIAAETEEKARFYFANIEPEMEITKIECYEGITIPVLAKGMTMEAYQHAAMRTCMESSRNVEYMTLNLVGEVGELCEKLLPFATDYETRRLLMDTVTTGQQAGKFAKAIRKKDYEPYHPINLEEVHEAVLPISLELGDVLWQSAGLADVLGLQLSEVADQNVRKLAARAEAGTIDGNGDGVSGKERTK